MKDVRKVSHTRPHASRKVCDDVEGPERPFTPGQFFAEAGTYIAVYLGLALLAHVLIAITGAQ